MKTIAIGTRVTVLTGRNSNGKVGTVTAIKGDICYVDFGGYINVNEGFGSVDMYPDGYWLDKRYVRACD